MNGRQWEKILRGADIYFKVFGNEDRDEVPVETFPYAAICAIHVEGHKRTNGEAVLSRGTGFLISPTRVVTAGHVLDDVDFRSETGVVIPQCTATNERLGRHPIAPTAVTYFRDWQHSYRYEDDLAVVKLPGPGVVIGEYLTLEAASDADIRRAPVEIAGYPTCVGADCENGVNDLPDAFRGRVMYAHNQKIAYLSPTQIYSEIDTWAGQSGAPMLAIALGNDKVIGVHCRGARQSHPDAHAKTHNSTLRLTTERINWIRSI